MCSLQFVMLFIGSLLTTVSVPGFDETSSDKFLCSLYIYGQQPRLSLRIFNVHTFTNPINTKWKGSFPNYKRTIHDFFHFVLKLRFNKVWRIATSTWLYYLGCSSTPRVRRPRRRDAVLYGECASSVLEQRYVLNKRMNFRLKRSSASY